MNEFYTYMTSNENDDFKKLPVYMQKCINISNDSYNSWGNGQEYMSSGKGQWNSDIELESIDEMWELDDLNECVNFYFRAEKKARKCSKCNGFGTTERAEEERNAIHYNKNYLDYEDVVGLYEDEWLKTKPKDLNDFRTNPEYRYFDIDALRIHTIVKRRAERKGFEYLCPECQGNGHVEINKEYSLSLQLWIIHPRKSSSLGVLIHNIKEQDLPKVFELLNSARERFNNKFSKIDVLKE